MPAPSLEPLLKINLNLNASDVAWFRRRYGRGYTERIRDVIRDHVSARRRAEERAHALAEPYLAEDFE